MRLCCNLTAGVLMLFFVSGCATESTDGGTGQGAAAPGDSAVANSAGVTMMDPMDGGSAGGGAHGAAAPATESMEAAEAGYAEGGHDAAEAYDDQAGQDDLAAQMEAHNAETAGYEPPSDEAGIDPAMQAAMEAGYAGGYAGAEGGAEGAAPAQPPQFPEGSAENAVVKIVMAVANGNADELKELSQFISEEAKGETLTALRSGEVSEEQLAKFKELMGRVKLTNKRNSKGKLTLTLQNDKGQFLHFRCKKKDDAFQVEELDVNTPRGR